MTVPRSHSIRELIRLASSTTIRRAAIFTAVGWLPVAILALLNGVGSLTSFLTDFAIQSRLLIVIPLLVVTEPNIRIHAELVAVHFLKAGLISSAEQPAFATIVASWQRLRTSVVARVVCVILSLFTASAFLSAMGPSTLLPWATGGGGLKYLSLAGTWALLVSMPVVVYLLFCSIWEQLVWAWFLSATSRLSLQLIPAHPDRVGGLSFVQTFLLAQYSLGFVVGTLVAGGVANRVVHNGRALYDFKYLPLIVAALVVMIFIGPYCTFMRKLLSAKNQGILEYDALALSLGRQFEQEWRADGKNAAPKDYLKVQDFSAAIDLYSVVAGVHTMNLVPVSFQNIRWLVAFSLLPAVPVILAAVPFESLFNRAFRFLS